MNTMSNKKGLKLEDDIISYLRDGRSGHTTSRKDIQNQHKDFANKKDVKHALKRLVKRRIINKDGKSYAYIKNNNTSQQNDIVPIGQRMPTEDDEQKIVKSYNNDEDDIKLSKMDLDEEIARLEAELAADDNDSDDDISDEDLQDSECDEYTDAPPNNKKTISFGQDSIHEYAVQSKSQTQHVLTIILMGSYVYPTLPMIESNPCHKVHYHKINERF